MVLARLRRDSGWARPNLRRVRLSPNLCGHCSAKAREWSGATLGWSVDVGLAGVAAFGWVRADVGPRSGCALPALRWGHASLGRVRPRSMSGIGPRVASTSPNSAAHQGASEVAAGFGAPREVGPGGGHLWTDRSAVRSTIGVQGLGVPMGRSVTVCNVHTSMDLMTETLGPGGDVCA